MSVRYNSFERWVKQLYFLDIQLLTNCTSDLTWRRSVSWDVPLQQHLAKAAWNLATGQSQTPWVAPKKIYHFIFILFHHIINWDKSFTKKRSPKMNEVFSIMAGKINWTLNRINLPFLHLYKNNIGCSRDQSPIIRQHYLCFYEST